MPEIDLGKMTDRELLIVTATTINGMSLKLDAFCLRVEAVEQGFNVLKAEHDLRTRADNCPPRLSRSKKELAATGGITGIIAVSLLLLVEYLLKIL